MPKLELVKTTLSFWLIVSTALTFHVQDTKAQDDRTKVLIWAASSMSVVMEKLVKDFENQNEARLDVSYGASSVLAKQISQNAPAALFISANKDWVEYLQKKKKITTIAKLASNQLVVVKNYAHKKNTDTIKHPKELVTLIGTETVAMGEPSHVPAGIYSKKILEKLSLWDDFKDQIVPAVNARLALNYVTKGVTPFGIVYKTDLKHSSQIHQVLNLSEMTAPRISATYYIAQLKNNKISAQSRIVAQRFMTYLLSEDAQAILEDAGFSR